MAFPLQFRARHVTVHMAGRTGSILAFVATI